MQRVHHANMCVEFECSDASNSIIITARIRFIIDDGTGSNKPSDSLVESECGYAILSTVTGSSVVTWNETEAINDPNHDPAIGTNVNFERDVVTGYVTAVTYDAEYDGCCEDTIAFPQRKIDLVNEDCSVRIEVI